EPIRIPVGLPALHVGGKMEDVFPNVRIGADDSRDVRIEEPLNKDIRVSERAVLARVEAFVAQQLAWMAVIYALGRDVAPEAKTEAGARIVQIVEPGSPDAHLSYGTSRGAPEVIGQNLGVSGPDIQTVGGCIRDLKPFLSDEVGRRGRVGWRGDD